MDILILLKDHLRRLDELKDTDELDRLIDELKNVRNCSIESSLDKKDSVEALQLINKIIEKIESLKKETISNIQTSNKKIKGLEAYSKGF
ncbi:hypothetical protein [Persephonella sp.]